MSSLLLKRSIHLSDFIVDPRHVITAITPRYAYDAENKRTNEITGYLYSVTNLGSFEAYNIFVEGQTPVMGIAEFAELQSSGQTLVVEFENAVVKPYYSTKTRQIEDSIKATSVKITK